MDKLKIEYVKTDTLKEYDRNAKIHTGEQIEQIKKSIEEFGMNDPIAVWKNNEIIEGHGRLIACTELGIEKVPIIRLDSLTDEQRRAYMIAHNKLTMNTGFDFSTLQSELESLQSIDMTDFGFNEAELLEIAIDDHDITGKKPIEQDYGNIYENIPVQDEEEEEEEQEEYKAELKRYQQNANDSQMVTKRIIIVYQNDEQERFIRAMLKLDNDETLNVVYNVKEIISRFKNDKSEK